MVIDFSAVKYGKLVAYRLDGERTLSRDKFVWVDVEEYQIFKVTLMQLIGMGGKKYPIIKYAIRDEQGELVRHNDMSFFSTKEDADKALAEIVYKRFEEASQ